MSNGAIQTLEPTVRGCGEEDGVMLLVGERMAPNAYARRVVTLPAR